ncbi:MAG: DUF2490 domain-containing protein [Bacteroidota bacterium]|nr:DUF2490 domain-containing protein [Bacteroidota bacterium]
MKIQSLLFFFLLIFYSLGNVFSQELKREINNQKNTWLELANSPKLSEKWGYTMEARIRRSDLMLNPQQLLFRTGIDYYFDNKSSITLGYAFVRAWPGKENVVYEKNEQRIWQQLLNSSKVGKLILIHRYRLEQRWIEQTEIPDNLTPGTDYDFLNRFRYRFLIQVPLGKSTMKDNTLFLALSNESFINFGNVQYNIFDQNRSYLGLGYKFTENSAIQLGYLNHLIVNTDGNRIANNHNIHLMLTYNMFSNL